MAIRCKPVTADDVDRSAAVLAGTRAWFYGWEVLSHEAPLGKMVVAPSRRRLSSSLRRTAAAWKLSLLVRV